jgi:hypothetical protein
MRIRHFLLASAGILAVGCAVCVPEATVRVLIPAPPGHWLHAFPDMRFQLEYRDSEGDRRCLEVSEWWLPVTVSCAKDANSPLMAYPRTSLDDGRETGGPGSLRPAGGVYPGSLVGSPDGEAIQLAWEDGALAALLWRLQDAGLDVSLLNAARLGERMRREPDPWGLDLDAMAEDLAGGAFTTYDADPLPCRDARIAAGAGTWFLESPFRAWRTAEGGQVAFTDVSLGIHGLYSANGRSLLFQATVEGIVPAPQCP